ncbi:P-loop containing nucleoside triphosphate hydrolase, putative [Plasmodium sp. gorilla clade G2]|uniref:P-loop containing nucleoside triphosphate hydrolase, putative n=1 Tax=Plasmodium sp. gorilla clade G2 TaxID=880535 RepID=UPI000D207EF5|nr:P-loop containing nucleoside triphosphate hydrolase, putative [Plasmodium sp. gorilla clade G2]SOV10734.1 P-loop containing nucleoside triphosphate hydrolase, putative [Plasmodium sp. gorilla clade G2]
MMKIFINNVNTYSGSCLCKTFDEIKNEKTEIYGTVDDQELSKDDCIMYNYDNVKKIISKIPKDNIVKYILKCKLVIYDLHNTNLEEIEYVIRKLKYEKIKNNMTIILISSIMTWNKTKRKFIKKIVEENKEITKNQYDNIGDKSGETNNNLEKKDNKNVEKNNQKTSKKKDKKKNENHNKNNKILDHGVSNKHGNIIKNEDIKSDLQQNLNEKINKKEKILYIPQIFNEKDYLKRISSAHFDEYKSVETLILSLNSMKNIKTHVVVSGLLYGNGESVFFSIFKNAWLSKDNHIIDKGDNYIPVIHIRGLCEYIKQLYISESKKKYLIAVDNQYITQKELIHTIASHLSGNMNFMHVSPHESIFYEHSEKLCVNLRFQCTNIYDDNEGKEQGKKKKSNKINKNKKKNEEEDISDNDEEDISDNDEGDISDNDKGDISDNGKEDISDNDKEDNDSDTDNSDSDKTEGNTEDENIDSEQSSNINMNDSNDDSKNGSIIDNDNNDDSDSDNSNMKKKDKKKKKNLKQTKNKNKNKTKNIITFHCQDGFINNIAIIAKEFCEFRNLKNLKVLIIGQPGVGKTFIAKKICDHYNLIMCSINILIDEYKNRTDYAFPKYYQEYINELDNEKKKNVPPKKLTLSDLSSLFYSKLENNECKFRGFVLDFFPRNYEEAKFFFENYKREVPEKNKEMSNGKRDEEDKNIKGNNKSKKKAKKKKNEKDDKVEDDNDKEEEDNDKEEDDDDMEEDDDEKEEDDNDMEEDDDKKEEEDDDKKEEDDDDKEEDDNDEDENDDDSEEGNNNDNSDYNEDNDDEKISENSENTNMLTHSDEESQSVKKSSNKKKKKKRKKKKKIIENINKYIIMPEFVIILKSTEELCKKRMMNLPENEIIKGHNDEIGFERRHKKYINENCRNDYFEFDQKQSIEDYFIENDIEVYTLNINENTLLEHILTNIYIFIEKNVKFNNFLPSTDEMLKNKLQEEQQILMDEKQKIKDIEDKVVLEEIKQNDDLIKAEKKRQQLLIKHQQQYIHNQSVPLRFYLIKNILPILTDALIYICKTKPKNPCLHIAQYLLENAHKYNIEEPNLENLQPEKDDEDNQINEKPKDEN